MSRHGSKQKIMPKKDIIVAVRMPKGLVDELRDIQKVNHFMDLSDEIRFIVRKHFISPQQDQDMIAELRRKEKLIEELTRIVDQLKNEHA